MVCCRPRSSRGTAVWPHPSRASEVAVRTGTSRPGPSGTRGCRLRFRSRFRTWSPSHSLMSMARAGQAAAALRAFAAWSGGGLSTSSTTTPSSSRWSNTSPAFNTHWPDETHLSWSTVTFTSGVLRDWRLPEPDDRVDEPGSDCAPTGSRDIGGLGERALEVGTGVHHQVARHDVALGHDGHRQIGQAAGDAVDDLHQRR